MSARRKAIRKAIVKRLKGRTRAKDNVRANRSERNWMEYLPAINVYTRGETDISELSSAPRLLRRPINVEIEIIDSGDDGDDISDKLDDLAEDVERYLSRDDSLGDTASDILLKGVSDMEAVDTGERPAMAVRLNYKVIYEEYSPRDQSGQGVGELDGIDAEWPIGHHDGPPTMDEADRAEDKIDLPD